MEKSKAFTRNYGNNQRKSDNSNRSYSRHTKGEYVIKILFVKRNRSYLLKSIIAWKNEKIKILAKVACPELLVLGVDKQKCMYVYLWVIFFISFRRFRGSPQLWGSGSRSF